MSRVLQLEMINTLSKVTGKKHFTKSNSLLYTINRHVKKDIMETVSPTIT